MASAGHFTGRRVDLVTVTLPFDRYNGEKEKRGRHGHSSECRGLQIKATCSRCRPALARELLDLTPTTQYAEPHAGHIWIVAKGEPKGGFYTTHLPHLWET